jgi:putative transposase
VPGSGCAAAGGCAVGDAYDDAMAESFFAMLERELLNRRTFKTQVEARMAVFRWTRAGTTRGDVLRVVDARR